MSKQAPRQGPVFVRCSSLPIFWECPSSQEPADKPYNPNLPAAQVGTAAHELLALVYDGPVKSYRIEQVAKKYQVDAFELAELAENGLTMWESLSDKFPNFEAEVALRSAIVGGSTDGRSWDKWHCNLLDWKTGREEKDCRLQMLGYAYSHRENHGMPKDDKISAFVLWVRSGNIDVFEFTNEDLDDFARLYRERVTGIGSVYSPGRHCNFCQHALTCKPRTAFLSQCVEVITGDAGEKDLGMAYEAWLHIQDIGERLKGIVKDKALQGESIKLPSGAVAHIAEMRRDNVDTRLAIETVLSELTIGELAKAITIKKSALPVDLQQKLGEVGAIRTTVSHQLRINRKKGN